MLLKCVNWRFLHVHEFLYSVSLLGQPYEFNVVVHI